MYVFLNLTDQDTCNPVQFCGDNFILNTFSRRKASNRHFQLNPILILEFDIGVRIIFLMDILKDNV